MDLQRYLVKPGEKIRLDDFDPDTTSGFDGSKEAGKKLIASYTDRLDDLQTLLYAQHEHKVLVIIQAMDTGGKDSTIRHIFSGVNPQGVRVASFKVPTPEEMDHDFLWRVHKQVPGKGEITIFNRSQYEDVLVVRVHSLVPEAVWKGRYEQINHFEKMLAETGTVILKFFLHISKDEQKARLIERRDDPKKRWKFNPGDLKERALWIDYMEAYEDAINRTSTEWAPWIVVPANHNWYRDLIVSHFLVQTLDHLKMTYPQAPAGIEQTMIE